MQSLVDTYRHIPAGKVLLGDIGIGEPLWTRSRLLLRVRERSPAFLGGDEGFPPVLSLGGVEVISRVCCPGDACLQEKCHMNPQRFSEQGVRERAPICTQDAARVIRPG
jgi:hypothetical protein